MSGGRGSVPHLSTRLALMSLGPLSKILWPLAYIPSSSRSSALAGTSNVKLNFQV